MPQSRWRDRRGHRAASQGGSAPPKPSCRVGGGKREKNRRGNKTTVTTAFRFGKVAVGIHHRDSEAQKRLERAPDCQFRQLWSPRLHAARCFSSIRLSLMGRSIFLLLSAAKLLNLLQPLQNRRLALKQPEHV